MIAEGIAAHHARRHDPALEEEIFGSHEPEEIAAALAGFVGAPVAKLVFYEASAGVVAGLGLEDGSRVVVKAHRPGTPIGHLEAAHRVQSPLAERGFPCPRPLREPRSLARGTGTLEELVDEGERRDAHDPAIRRALAETLARLVATAPDLAQTPGLGAGVLAEPAGLWPQPHSPRFDFDASRRGSEWIDRIGERARERLREPAGELVLAHDDWSAKHFRFVGDRVHVVYDWDSLDRSDEPRLVGQAAATFTATWYLDVPLVPSPDEARAFVAEYERARGRRFDPGERRRLAAAATYVLAYNARCESCGDPVSTGLRAPLARHADEYLAL